MALREHAAAPPPAESDVRLRAPSASGMHGKEALSVSHPLTYTWSYAPERPELRALYEKSKGLMWNATTELAWSTSVDPESELVHDAFNPIYGTPMWKKLDPKREIPKLRQHMTSYILSNFLHGEQGALLATSQIVACAPTPDAKLYAAAQVFDEARHVEAYDRYLREKVELVYPPTKPLRELLDQILTDSRWDMKYLGMQILVEGVALGAFGLIHQTAHEPLIKDITRRIMQDEARHVAFGVQSLRGIYDDMTESELRDREDFILAGSRLLRDRFLAQEVWENVGLPKKECEEAALQIGDHDDVPQPPLLEDCAQREETGTSHSSCAKRVRGARRHRVRELGSKRVNLHTTRNSPPISARISSKASPRSARAARVAEIPQPPARRERNAEQTKKRILDAAEREFAAKGFDGARLRTIARAADVQEALIHHYFDAKEGLYHEVLRGGLDAMAEGIWPIVRTMSDAAPVKKRRGAAQMRALSEAFVDLLLGFFATNGAFLAILRHEAERGELAARIVAESVKPVFEAIVHELNAMRARGEVRRDVDARHLCLSAVGMVAFPFQEETFVTSIWAVRVREKRFLEERKNEIVEMILARVLP